MPVLRKEAIASVHDAGGSSLFDRFEGGDIGPRALNHLHCLYLEESDGQGEEGHQGQTAVHLDSLNSF